MIETNATQPDETAQPGSATGATVAVAVEEAAQGASAWDAATGAPHGEPMRHEGPVLSMAFSEDGTTIATGSYDGMARLWDAASGKELQTLQ